MKLRMLFGFSLCVLVAGCLSAVNLSAEEHKGAPTTISESDVEKTVAHSYAKHVVEQKEFETLTGAKHLTHNGKASEQEKELGTIVKAVVHSGEKSVLANDRFAYYDKTDNILVIYNKKAPAQSTVFRPTGGETYFKGLK